MTLRRAVILSVAAFAGLASYVSGERLISAQPSPSTAETGAATALQAHVTEARQLAAREPTNDRAQADLVALLDALGDVKLQAGDGPGAFAAYEESLSVNRKRVVRSPTDTKAQSDLATSLSEIGDARMKAGDQAGALNSYAESIGIEQKLKAKGVEFKSAESKSAESTSFEPKSAESRTAAEPKAQPATTPPRQQAMRRCGWYAITACKTSARQARAYANTHHTGVVINTSSPGYAAFRKGYYCVVSGPSGRDVAMAAAARLRMSGVSPEAYAKDSCSASN